MSPRRCHCSRKNKRRSRVSRRVSILLRFPRVHRVTEIRGDVRRSLKVPLFPAVLVDQARGEGGGKRSIHTRVIESRFFGQTRGRRIRTQGRGPDRKFTAYIMSYELRAMRQQLWRCRGRRRARSRGLSRAWIATRVHTTPSEFLARTLSSRDIWRAI